MTEQAKNFTAAHIGPLEGLLNHDFRGLKGKYFIGGELGLTGCEASLNRLPAGKAMPFVHAHRKNEELYIVLRGNGTFFVDGDEFPVQEGSLVRVAPQGERSWKAGDEDLYFICIQAEENSLSQATLEDGFRIPTAKASWMAE
ncbi:cupin domain-containing protein [Oryzomonas sagensis]|uniref:Cupin domain-containing protein n=1 Tax=Oryzomonas sagensis TaxID=2603857 RepID=A0ABQ6TKN9_9BACT|nr:cupin domain-containing protein [Oryzomonas sagensis]KAB0668709.1 cupin domain-containing protein [Oryzomonas sagensis]